MSMGAVAVAAGVDEKVPSVVAVVGGGLVSLGFHRLRNAFKNE